MARATRVAEVARDVRVAVVARVAVRLRDKTSV